MFSDPEKNLKAFALRENMIVADLGAGSGFYTIPAARRVLNGKVYAIEIQKDFLPTIRNKASDAGLKNIEAIWGDIERLGGTKLADHICDRVIASNVFSQLEDREGFLLELIRILKPEGEVLFIEWSPGLALATGKNDRTVTRDKALAVFNKHGFTHVSDVSAGASHYGMILKKNK